jgi:hypothetical protein
VCSFEHTIRACVFYRTHTPAIVYTSRYLKPTVRKPKARARWVPTSEASELIKNRRYFSCKEKEYIARKCPKYRSASRSAEINYTTASEPVSNNKGSKSGSSYKTGKK